MIEVIERLDEESKQKLKKKSQPEWTKSMLATLSKKKNVVIPHIAAYYGR